ncbi:hypothetical protein DL95DRAFT_460864 [Leptodontidium sp. 2 PMI_412]|nr:hypothetical protein DL95DRAFT_460864 [Leptodontidium sp. 2 PMI_412]
MMHPLYKFDSTLAFLWLVSLILPSSASSLDTVCGSIKKLGSCKAVINVPTLAIKTCKEEFFKVVPCKTKFGGKYPYGVSWKGIKYCDGWTCVPGTIPTVISVPCGVNAGSKKLDVCAVARKGIPNLDEITRLAAGYCKCLPGAFDFIDLDTAKSAITSLDTGEATYSILSKFGSMEQCMVENALNVQDNKDGLSTGSGALVQSANTKIFTAAEIDITRYREFASALAPCFIGDCDGQAVRAWFIDYLTDSEKVMGEQFKDFLSPWKSAFEGISGNLDNVGKDIGNIEEQFGTINQSISQITMDETIQTSQALIGLQATLTSTVTNAQDLYKIISDAIVTFDTLSDLGIDTIVEKVISGEIRSISQVADTLQAAKRLPTIIEQIEKTLPNIKTYVKSLADSAPTLVTDIEAIVSGSWLGDAQADANSAAAAEDAVKKIQTLLQDGVVSHITSISTGVTSMVSSLELITSGGSPSIQAVRVASYQRWSKGHFSMPCLTTGKITLKLGGFSQQVDYPKFYRCEQNYRIPFPNHHIPYIKISFGTTARIRATLKQTGHIRPRQRNAPPLETAALTEYDPTATEIALEPERTAFTMPPDLYEKAEEVPAQTTPPSSLVFFATTDVNGITITASTALAEGTTLEVTTTEVSEAVETGGVDEATPSGFEEGPLAPSTITPGPTATATSTGKKAKSASKKSAGSVVETSACDLLAVMDMFVLFY